MTIATEPRHSRTRVHATVFKEAVGRFASGVTVVAVRRDGETIAKTVSAFSSLSLDPPLIGVAIGGHTPLAALLRAGGAFGVSVLADDQAAVSDWFARPSRGGTAPAAFVHDQHPEAPVLDRCLSRLCCRVVDVVGTGDHVVAVGEVQAVRTTAGTPLLHHDGRYHALVPHHINKPQEVPTP